MKIVEIFLILGTCLGSLGSLNVDARRCTANDTVVGTNEDQNDLMNFLKGTWDISGSWTIEEGQGKIVKKIRARIVGTETFTPILNGHFLQKQINARVKYNSRDLNKSIQNSFTAMAILTFNNNLNNFFSWYFDCSGTFMESKGTFNHSENNYSFVSTIMDNNRQEVQQTYSMTIVDETHYRWEVTQRKDSASEWESTATGLSTRKN